MDLYSSVATTILHFFEDDLLAVSQSVLGTEPVALSLTHAAFELASLC